MKKIIFICFCSIGLINSSYAQSTEVDSLKQVILVLENDLDSSLQLLTYRLKMLKKENETLRQILKGYVYQIDSLNTQNILLREKLELNGIDPKLEGE